MSLIKILIIDGEYPAIDSRLERALSGEGYSITQISELERLPDQLSKFSPELLIVDNPLSVVNGTTLLSLCRSLFDNCPIIAMSRFESIENVVKTIRAGASDFLVKPVVDGHLFRAAVNRALSGKQKNPVNIKHTDEPRAILTRSEKISNLLKIAKRVAESDATVLINGESGTGKELLARYIHQHSKRSKQQFIAMNCAALPENLAESELFGFEKGAFTGALKFKQGKFEMAHHGTLLLDEISEMQLPLQAKLLRVLQEKQIDRIGGNQCIDVDARIIATTNRDLNQMVRNGHFREDLYYRLRVIPLILPPLRDHPEDIIYLAEQFLIKFSQKTSLEPKKIGECASKALLDWRWPGNIRELENTVQRAALLSCGKFIRKEDLQLQDEESDKPTKNHGNGMVGMTVSEIEKILITKTLTHVDNNRTQAAQMLGISIRTLRNKLNEYRCDIPDLAAGR